MIATHTAKRLLPFALAASVVVAVFAGAANGRTQSVTFVAGPDRVVQGNPATFTVNVIADTTRGPIVIEDGAYFKGSIDIVKPEPGKASKPQVASPAPAAAAAPVAAGAADKR